MAVINKKLITAKRERGHWFSRCTTEYKTTLIIAFYTGQKPTVSQHTIHLLNIIKDLQGKQLKNRT